MESLDTIKFTLIIGLSYEDPIEELVQENDLITYLQELFIRFDCKVFILYNDKRLDINRLVHDKNISSIINLNFLKIVNSCHNDIYGKTYLCEFFDNNKNITLSIIKSATKLDTFENLTHLSEISLSNYCKIIRIILYVFKIFSLSYNSKYYKDILIKIRNIEITNVLTLTFIIRKINFYSDELNNRIKNHIEHYGSITLECKQHYIDHFTLSNIRIQERIIEEAFLCYTINHFHKEKCIIIINNINEYLKDISDNAIFEMF